MFWVACWGHQYYWLLIVILGRGMSEACAALICQGRAGALIIQYVPYMYPKSVDECSQNIIHICTVLPGKLLSLPLSQFSLIWYMH